jgi:hypothetical protein
MSTPPFNPLRALDELVRHGVRFVLIGGYAARLRGSPSITNDLDVCYERDDENLERLASALTELRAGLRGAPPDVPFILDAKTLRMGDHFTFVTDAGGLDCLGTPSGVGGFDDLERNASDMDLDGLTVRVSSIDDLMRMKRAAGRPKDRVELEILGALREEIDALEAERRKKRKR